MKNLILILLVFLPLQGCERIDLSVPFNAVIGKSYKLDNTLSFTIDSIRDYRCPKDVVCIWSGDVDMFFSIKHNFSRTDTTIHLLTKDNNPFGFAGYVWQVKEVTPHLKQGEEAKQTDYTINMVITR